MAVKRFKIKGTKKLPKQFELEFEVLGPEPVVGPDHPVGLGLPERTTETKVEAFNARAECPGIMLLDVAAAMAGDGGEQSKGIRDFLTDVIVAGERQRWRAILDSETNVIDRDDLADIANWLLEQYGEEDRPTETV